MSAVNAVVFDIGGVLAVTDDTEWRASSGANHERLLPVWKAGSVGSITLKEVERRVAEVLGLDDARLAAFMSELWEEYLGTLNVALAEYFRGLRPRYRTAIISNSFVGATEREHARFRWEEMCDLVVYSHEVGIEKPDPRIFELTYRRLGVSANNAVFLDNVETHVAAARLLGSHGVVYRSNGQAIGEIEAILGGS